MQDCRKVSAGKYPFERCHSIFALLTFVCRHFTVRHLTEQSKQHTSLAGADNWQTATGKCPFKGRVFVLWRSWETKASFWFRNKKDKIVYLSFRSPALQYLLRNSKAKRRKKVSASIRHIYYCIQCRYDRCDIESNGHQKSHSTTSKKRFFKGKMYCYLFPPFLLQIYVQYKIVQKSVFCPDFVAIIIQ